MIDYPGLADKMRKHHIKEQRRKRLFGVIWILIGLAMAVMEYWLSPGYYACGIVGAIYAYSGIKDIYEASRPL